MKESSISGLLPLPEGARFYRPDNESEDDPTGVLPKGAGKRDLSGTARRLKESGVEHGDISDILREAGRRPGPDGSEADRPAAVKDQ